MSSIFTAVTDETIKKVFSEILEKHVYVGAEKANNPPADKKADLVFHVSRLFFIPSELFGTEQRFREAVEQRLKDMAFEFSLSFPLSILQPNTGYKVVEYKFPPVIAVENNVEGSLDNGVSYRVLRYYYAMHDILVTQIELVGTFIYVPNEG